MLRRPASSLLRTQVRVIENDRHGGKALREATDIIRIGVARSAVARDWTTYCCGHFQIRIEFTVIWTILIDSRMQFNTNKTVSETRANITHRGLSRSDP